MQRAAQAAKKAAAAARRQEQQAAQQAAAASGSRPGSACGGPAAAAGVSGGGGVTSPGVAFRQPGVAAHNPLEELTRIFGRGKQLNSTIVAKWAQIWQQQLGLNHSLQSAVTTSLTWTLGPRLTF